MPPSENPAPLSQKLSRKEMNSFWRGEELPSGTKNAPFLKEQAKDVFRWGSKHASGMRERAGILHENITNHVHQKLSFWGEVYNWQTQENDQNAKKNIQREMELIIPMCEILFEKVVQEVRDKSTDIEEILLPGFWEEREKMWKAEQGDNLQKMAQNIPLSAKAILIGTIEHLKRQILVKITSQSSSSPDSLVGNIQS